MEREHDAAQFGAVRVTDRDLQPAVDLRGAVALVGRFPALAGAQARGGGRGNAAPAGPPVLLVPDRVWTGIDNAPHEGWAVLVRGERIEAVDMGRRGIHDEGAELLRERLAGKIDFDHKTARRLFTLLCALRWKG